MSMVWSDRHCSWNLSHLACSPRIYHINPWFTTIFRSILGSLILRHTQIILPSLENDPLIVQKTKNLQNPQALEGALQSWLLWCHKQAFIPTTKQPNAAIGDALVMLWIFVTLKLYNTRFQQNLPTFLQYGSKSNLRQPLKKTTATIAPSWQHTCPALTAPMAAFMQGVSHLIRENFGCTSGISFKALGLEESTFILCASTQTWRNLGCIDPMFGWIYRLELTLSLH